MDLPFSQVLEQEIQEWNKFSKRGPSPEPIQLSKNKLFKLPRSGFVHLLWTLRFSKHINLRFEDQSEPFPYSFQ